MQADLLLESNLKKELLKLSKIDPDEKTFILKQKGENLIWADKLDEIHKDKFFTGNIDDVKKIKIGLEFVETQEQKDLFKYFHTKVASYKYASSVGKRIKVLIKDSITNKYLGLLTLASELINIAVINDYLKKNLNTNHKNVINNILNIRCCISIPPFSFNFNGGKLLATLAFSKEIFDYYNSKYNDKLIGLSTMGLYGKSIQYDRNKYLKYIGKTKGFTVKHIDSKIISDGRVYLKKLGFNSERYRGLYVLTELIKQFDLDISLIPNTQQNGIYFGFYQENKETAQEIFNNWINRWAEQRYNHLLKNNKIKEYIISKSASRTKKYYDKIINTIGIEEYRKLNREKAQRFRENKKKNVIL